jgi:hypothetical protein
VGGIYPPQRVATIAPRPCGGMEKIVKVRGDPYVFSFGKVAVKCTHLKRFLKKFLLTVGIPLSHNDYFSVS